MPGTTPAWDLPYPLATDPVRDGDDVIRQLAEALDGYLVYVHDVSGIDTPDALIASVVGLAAAPVGGGADDTTALQDKLNGGNLRLRSGATYLVTSLTVPAGRTLDLNGATVKKLSGTAHLLVPGAGAVVCNGTLDGNGLAGSGVRIAAAADVTCRDLTANNFGVSTAFDCNAATRPTLVNCSSVGAYYGLLLNAGTTGARVFGGTHRNGTATASYEGSVYTPNCSRSRLTGVVVESAGSHGFYDQGSDNTFVNCVARACGNMGGAYDHRGVTTDGSYRSTWIGCTFTANAECGLYDMPSSVATTLVGCTAQGNNVALRPGGHGFELNGSAYDVTGCTSMDQLGNAAIEGGGFYLGGRGSLANCRASNNYAHGFYVYDNPGCTLTGCTAVDNNRAGTAHDGFAISGTSPYYTGNVIVAGCLAFDTGTPKKQRYACSVTTAASNYVLANNIFRAADNLTGGLSDSGNTPKSVVNNLTA